MKRIDVWRRPTRPPDRRTQLRDAENRRTVGGLSDTIDADRAYMDNALKEIADILAGLGSSWEVPPRNPSTPPCSGSGVGGL